MLTVNDGYKVVEVGEFYNEASCNEAMMIVSSEQSSTSNIFICLEEPKIADNNG
jgi:hypothetical protein